MEKPDSQITPACNKCSWQHEKLDYGEHCGMCFSMSQFQEGPPPKKDGWLEHLDRAKEVRLRDKEGEAT